MNSQNDEEEVISQFFGNRTGRLLDVGAYDGKSFSNSFALLNSGWSGVLVEPSPIPFSKLLDEYGDNKNVELVNAAIDTSNGLMKFWETKNDAISTTEVWHRDLWSQHGAKYREMYVASITFSNLFSYFTGLFNFVNIDTEGSNMRVLESLPVSSIGVELLCVEYSNYDKVQQPDATISYLKNIKFTPIHITPQNVIARKN